MHPDKKNVDYNGLIVEIRNVLSQGKAQLSRQINSGLITTYWNIGQLIAEKENAERLSSRQFILELSQKLTKEIGRGFSRSNLFNMRQFYLKYESVQSLTGHLSWTHICELLTIENEDKRSFYEEEIKNSNWSVRELKRQMKSSLFERLLLSKGEINKETVYRLSKEGQFMEKPEDLIKEPYVLEFLGIPENKPILESDLEKRLIEYIEDFLLELGRGFMFVGSQQRITVGNNHNYIDMVFYNKILRAYVLIDLKMQKLKSDNVGQMNSYLNYYKQEVNDEFDNEPIGIILCTDKDEIEAEYALGGISNQIFASKYVYYIPEKQRLIEEVQKVIEKFNEEEMLGHKES